MTPTSELDERCDLEDGDDVFCDWELPDKCHPLHYAANVGNIEMIRSWVASGVDVNVTNLHKVTPLMCACAILKEECVEELLQLGANVNMIDKVVTQHCIMLDTHICPI